MILSTINGLYSVNLISENVKFLHPKTCKQLEINDLEIFCLDEGIWKINILNSQSGFKNIIQEKILETLLYLIILFGQIYLIECA